MMFIFVARKSYPLVVSITDRDMTFLPHMEQRTGYLLVSITQKPHFWGCVTLLAKERYVVVIFNNNIGYTKELNLKHPQPVLQLTL